VSTTVIKDKSLDELALSGHLVLHMHYLNHVQVDGLALASNGVYSLNNDVSQGIGNTRVNLGHEGSTSDLDEEFLGYLLMRNLDLLEEGKSLLFGKFDTVNKGWTPSPRYLSACLISSPMKRTFEVVPSPTMSS
jgi:hypothetical protein